MAIFRRVRRFFIKPITINQKQRSELVGFVKLRFGKLKFGNEVIVENGYNFVVVHYNKVCDILFSGSHIIDETTIPKLIKFSKSYFRKKGVEVVKKIKTDAYFVNLNEIKLNYFKTPERIVAINNSEKIKIKIDGTCTIRVVDCLKLMKTLCSDYAIIRNKKVLKEICSTIGFDVSKILNKRLYSLADYLSNKEKIAETLNIEINKYVEKFGLNVGEFFINSIILPKSVNGKEENKDNLNNFDNTDIVSAVEAQINGIEKNTSIIKEAKEQKAEEEQKNEIEKLNKIENDDKNVIRVGIDKSYQSTTNNNFSNTKVENNKENSSLQNNVDFCDFNKNNGDNFSNINLLKNNDEDNKRNKVFINMNFNAPSPDDDKLYTPNPNQAEPNLFNYENTERNEGNNSEVNFVIVNSDDNSNKEIENKKDIYASENENKFLTKKRCKYCGEQIDKGLKYCVRCGKPCDDLVICACCGAKNFSDAKICCICKSNL